VSDTLKTSHANDSTINYLKAGNYCFEIIGTDNSNDSYGNYYSVLATTINGDTLNYTKYDRFNFDDTRLVNASINYASLVNSKTEWLRLYKLPVNKITLVKKSKALQLTNQLQTVIINVIPASDTSDLILGKLWIDNKRNVVLKSQLTTKSNGTILTEYNYGKQINYGLPDNMIFTVDVKKFKIPKSVSADINNSNSKVDDKSKDNKKGKIYLRFSDYQINKGIADSVFKK
jgi:hypothetical protein